MKFAIVGAGIAGLSAAWHLSQAGHKVAVFEKNYKPGGRMNSRRKAGLVVDHGERFIFRQDACLQELINNSGLKGHARSILRPIFSILPDGSIGEGPEEKSVDPNRLTFPEGNVALPEALRRSVGGFYSIGVRTIAFDAVLNQYVLETNPPLRSDEVQVDGVVVACAAPVAWAVSQALHEHLNPAFVEGLARAPYTRCLSLMCATTKVETQEGYYGLNFSPEAGSMLQWLALEDQKCQAREVEGWSCIVAHSTPQTAERLWDEDYDAVIESLYAEARKYMKELPASWRWARVKRWEIARLQPGWTPLTHAEFPVSHGDMLVDFCGDYRVGDGVERAAQSGKEAALRLLEKTQNHANKDDASSG